MSSSRTSGAGAAKRLIKELEAWRAEQADEETTTTMTTPSGIERLGPLHESDLLTWEAVFNGRGVGGGYDGMYIHKTHSLYAVPFPLLYIGSLPVHTQLTPNPQKAAGSSLSASQRHTRTRRRRSAS